MNYDNKHIHSLKIGLPWLTVRLNFTDLFGVYAGEYISNMILVFSTLCRCLTACNKTGNLCVTVNFIQPSSIPELMPRPAIYQHFMTTKHGKHAYLASAKHMKLHMLGPKYQTQRKRQ